MSDGVTAHNVGKLVEQNRARELREQRTKNDADPAGVLMFGAVPFAILVVIDVFASGSWATFAVWGAVIIGGAIVIAAMRDTAAEGRHQARVQGESGGSPDPTSQS